MPSPATLSAPVAFPKSTASPAPHPQPPPQDVGAGRAGSNSPVGAGAYGSQGKSQTVFIHKLFDMLEDASLSHLIWWLPTQDSFCLYPGEEFSNVLAQYFKHTNIASFIRQLNMYGFHKVNDNFQNDDKQQAQGGGAEHGGAALAPPQTRWEFRHSANHFRKGDVEALSLIKRKSSKVISSHKEIVSLKTLPPTSHAHVDDAKPGKPAASPKPYAVPMYPSPWAPPAAKNHMRQPSAVYAAGSPGMGLYAYPLYAPPVAMPRLPSSPGLSDPPLPSPSYFLHQPLHPTPLLQHAPASSADQAVHLKLLELGTAVNGLKAAYLDLLARHESLAVLHQRSQADVFQLKELMDRCAAAADAPRRDDVVDRKLANTPVNRVGSPGHDGMSPTSVRPPAYKDQPRSLATPADAPARPPLKPPQSYHLSDASRPVPAPGIVPQAYPLNPNYTLYNSGDGAARPAAPLKELMDRCAAAADAPRRDDVVDRKLANTPVNRVGSPGHDGMSPTSVRPPAYKDQPRSLATPADAPARPPLKPPQSYHLSDASRPVPAPGIVPQAYPLNPNYTLYNSGDGAARPAAPVGDEPLPLAARPAANRQVSVLMDPLQPAPPAGAARSTPPNGGPEKPKDEDPQPYVQQYQPFAPAHAYYQHMMQDQSHLRTTSLPVMLHPLPQQLAASTPQRHLMNLFYQQREEQARAGIVRPATAPKEPGLLAKTPVSELHLKKTLPSMEELNKSLRSASPAARPFTLQLPGKGEDEQLKRRKVEE
ncbi:hypothetical protein METBIDRAFT_12149 [Metschnikowia bicuspidata var. bicuspidata NRRL YB-4993]|uniref:HSF-type DNA-binding domain-containing protein n=1 Tax=Metschnikowia bicuspidata var. bicuspidata NRRL YB-4993 TaxID=869754 RepID=A0A1A0HCQ1_9ASCO|nr:hypothetical protein METBIDRAFT_12149 [Metschnikowia bicuspidata var. bicuspidata NRRL YB-4993]OBA21667.1 hypothetical protein METBIDRAFT_12149 [Metschnikowia bicuspidata var. bicuspidata NRRL YB-4993]